MNFMPFGQLKSFLKILIEVQYEGPNSLFHVLRCSKMGYQASSIRVYCLRLENEIAIGLRIQIQRHFFTSSEADCADAV